MLPSHYVCTGCRIEFRFKFRSADYYIGTSPLGSKVDGADLLGVPVRPAWCKDCGCLCLAEDVAPLRAFENAYGSVRCGRSVEYPINTEFMDQADSERLVGAYLLWRMNRRHPARALCCGGSNYQLMAVEQPLFKHADCDFGVVEAVNLVLGSYNGPGPGVLSPANDPLYSTEGELIGLLTRRKQGSAIWVVEPVSYLAPTDS